MSEGAERITFSVVVPTLGRARSLDGCLAALAGLDYPRERYEVVVVNDGGGPEIDRVASSWKSRFDLVQEWTGGEGPSAARNAGATAARGTFIAFTDDDCRPDSGWLSELEDALEANPGCAVGGRMRNGAPGRCAAASSVVLGATYAHFNRKPGNPRFFATSNLAFPADDLRALGGFDESLLHAEDREMCERWVHSGRCFASAPLAVVDHMRELTPRQFLSQQYGYGRGAWAVRRSRMERDRGRFKVDPGFYRELARQIRQPDESFGALSLGVLAIASQTAAAAGFAREAIAARAGRSSAPREVTP